MDSKQFNSQMRNKKIIKNKQHANNNDTKFGVWYTSCVQNGHCSMTWTNYFDRSEVDLPFMCVCIAVHSHIKATIIFENKTPNLHVRWLVDESARYVFANVAFLTATVYSTLISLLRHLKMYVVYLYIHFEFARLDKHSTHRNSQRCTIDFT